MVDEVQRSGADRRKAVARGAVQVIARDGLRGLTHRAVDRECGFPEGTTSNYARTRRNLLDLVVAHLAARTGENIVYTGPPPKTVEAAVEILTHVFRLVAAREADGRARYALVVALADIPELHSALTDASPVRNRLLAAAEATLVALGIPEPKQRAVDLVGLMSGLIFDQLCGSGRRGTPVDVGNVLTAWLKGLGAR